MNISQIAGLTEAQKITLETLGAVEDKTKLVLAAIAGEH